MAILVANQEQELLGITQTSTTMVICCSTSYTEEASGMSMGSST